MGDERFKDLAAQEDGCMVSAGSPPFDYAKRNAEFSPDWSGMPNPPQDAVAGLRKLVEDLCDCEGSRLNGRARELANEVRAALAKGETQHG